MLNRRSMPLASAGLRGELLRFLVVGISAVAIDFASYRMLLSVGLAVHIAKASSFVIGAVFAYFANRSITFRVGPSRRRHERLRFVAVYAAALAVNVSVNAAVLAVLGRSEPGFAVAFLAATGVSATLNFIGMKLLVFSAATDPTDATDTTHATGASAAISGHASQGGAATIDGPRLSLVIPCYNEAANLPLLVQRLRETFTGDDAEVILVDNGSTDGSPAVLTELLAGQQRIRSLRVEHNQGYGYGILAGLREARGSILGWTHADLQTDPHDALRALALFDGGAGFVKGRRRGRPAGDVVFTLGMSVFESVLLRRPLWDINAQPTLFPREFFARWQQPPDDFSLDLYVYYQAVRAGLRVQRLPVHFGARAHGHSHWNVNWRAKARFIKRTVDFSLRLQKDL